MARMKDVIVRVDVYVSFPTNNTYGWQVFESDVREALSKYADVVIHKIQTTIEEDKSS
jgi:hypothetical protein